MKDHGPSVKSEAYTQDDLMRSQEPPPTVDMLVKNHLDEMASLVDTEETVRTLMCRTHGSTLLNLDEMDETSSVSSDELGLLSSKVVDVPSQQTLPNCCIASVLQHGPLRWN